jgi:hypothetical protein
VPLASSASFAVHSADRALAGVPMQAITAATLIANTLRFHAASDPLHRVVFLLLVSSMRSSHS